MSLENKYSICKGLCVSVCVCVCRKNSEKKILVQYFFTFLICVSLGKEVTNANSTLLCCSNCLQWKYISFYSKYIILKENIATWCHSDNLKIEIYLYTCLI